MWEEQLIVESMTLGSYLTIELFGKRPSICDRMGLLF